MANDELITNLLQRIHAKSKGRLHTELAKVLTTECCTRRAVHLEQIAKVKTIWQVDTPVDVTDFYFPPRIESSSKAKRIESIKELTEGGPVVLEGIAGQGKSVFLRYMTLVSAASGSNIPIFVQLRHISNEITLNQLVGKALESILGSTNRFLLDYLVRNQLIVFLLDGFDEVDTKFRSRTLKELHDFIEVRSNYPVVVTARPHSDIQNSPLFAVTWISQLSLSDRDLLIAHLADDPETRNMILEGLRGKEHISGVLTTPLLVTLLIITYKAHSEIPDQLSEFYRSLFATLLMRHDKTKPGYLRERRTKLGNVDFERVFETVCFLSLNDYKLSLTERELDTYVQTSLNSLYLDSVVSGDYADDLARVTCLLIKEGDKFYYLHKSIAEYFSAQKVAEESDVDSKYGFYKQLRDNIIPENWYQTIFFLSEIDHHCYVEELLLPKLRQMFGLPQNETLPPALPRVSREAFTAMVGDRAEIVVKKKGRSSFSVRLIQSSDEWFSNTFLQRPVELTIQAFIDDLPDSQAFQLYNFNQEVSHRLNECFDHIYCWEKFLSHLNNSDLIRKAYQEPLQLHKRIATKTRLSRPLFQLHLKRQ